MARCPLNYSLCRQQITIYRNSSQKIMRTVLGPACLQWTRKRETDSMGTRDSDPFLLILPCGENPLCVGDRILAGVGPTFDSWQQVVDNTGEITEVTDYFWQGVHCHTEAKGE